MPGACRSPRRPVSSQRLRRLQTSSPLPSALTEEHLRRSVSTTRGHRSKLRGHIFERGLRLRGTCRTISRCSASADPEDLDVAELECVFRQPLDAKPVLARFKGLEGELADVDRSIVLDQHDQLDGLSWLGAVQKSSCSRWAMKSLNRLVALVCTVS